MTGCVFNIQKFSIHDGPGIRTTVFLKGCPLRCLWCHNPEGLSREREIEYEPTKCILCGACGGVCENHAFSEESGHLYARESCTRCGRCLERCVAGALKFVGNDMTVEQVMKKVLSDKIFYETSGGGMTVSGGEPFYQHEFTTELLKAAKAEGLHTAVETSGFCRTEIILAALPCIDLFLFDYKATGDELHRKLTGVPQAPILDTLRAVSDAGGKIVLRCPIIPGANDTEEHFAAIAALAEEISGIEHVDLEPYHPLGTGKAEKIGKVQEFVSKIPEKDRMEEIRSYIAGCTSKPVKIS